MVDAANLREYASSALMVVSVIAMTAGADVVDDPGLSAALAVGGGIGLVVGGFVAFRVLERGDEVDERSFQIGLRSAAVSLWTLVWGLYVWSQLQDNTTVTMPIFDSSLVLTLLAVVVFLGAYTFYDRVLWSGSPSSVGDAR
ncbi:hypothetical protein [Halopiger goleimassiliensis]|uniref:hypothetical protein n=1 Tax=Halopiger goleimassiliensis TaxID=1293048 RepID=UPI000677A505|nr:hypothetical protein [Halopiger goleimassiliensis]